MLKIYKIIDSVSIDSAKWRRVGGWGYRVTDEEVKNCVVLDNKSFDETREYLSRNLLSGVWNDSTFTFFGEGKPTIQVSYNDAWDTVEYRHFDKISYKREFEEWTDVSLQWIMENLSADQCIQYLKERGMNTCPLNTTK